MSERPYKFKSGFKRPLKSIVGTTCVLSERIYVYANPPSIQWIDAFTIVTVISIDVDINSSSAIPAYNVTLMMPDGAVGWHGPISSDIIKRRLSSMS